MKQHVQKIEQVHVTGDSLDSRVVHSPLTSASIIGVGTATPATDYSQTEVLDVFGIKDRRARSVFLNSAIEKRFLTLPSRGDDGPLKTETQGELLHKHRVSGIDMGSRAIKSCVANFGADLGDIAYLCCVTTTGFLVPGFSALLCRELELVASCVRLDVVGMGCNAGLNALNAVSTWASVNPGKLAIMLCVEVCSAGYVIDDSMRSIVVNSLFGDGAAAVAIKGGSSGGTSSAPVISKFYSHMIADAIDAMRFDWDDGHGKFNFFLDPEVPYVVGANAEQAIDGLLSGTCLRRSNIAHWLVHSGGKKVIDAVKVNLGLSTHDLRHTSGVLRDYGNLSSGSFLFSYKRLLQEGRVERGDYGVMMTMGPGSTIEAALLEW